MKLNFKCMLLTDSNKFLFDLIMRPYKKYIVRLGRLGGGKYKQNPDKFNMGEEGPKIAIRGVA